MESRIIPQVKGKARPPAIVKNKKTRLSSRVALLLIAVGSLFSFTTTHAADPEPWRATLSTSCPTQADGAHLTEVDGTVYIKNNEADSFYSFNTTTETCAALASSPQIFTNSDIIGVDSDTILLISTDDSLHHYDISEDEWYAFDRAILDTGVGINQDGADQNSGNVVVGHNSELYVLAGGGFTTFQKYTPATNTWTNLASLPAGADDGAAMAVVGNDIYAFSGSGTTGFYKYDTTQTPGSDSWDSGITQAPAAVEAGGALATVGTDVYAFRGDNTREFWSYDTVGDSWNSSRPIAPSNVRAGGALATLNVSGTDYVYAFQGNNAKSFWRFNASTQAWDETLSDAPRNVLGGGALATDGTDIFALRGGDSVNYYKYTQGTDTWSELGNIPLQHGENSLEDSAGGITFIDNTIWAVTGAGRNGTSQTDEGLIWRYPFTGAFANTWPKKDVPVSKPDTTTVYGTSMVHPGTSTEDPSGDYMYVLQGLNTNDFWRYSLSQVEWIPFHRPLTAASKLVPQFAENILLESGGGNTLITVNSEIYYIPGNASQNDQQFLKYNPTTNVWTVLADMPEGFTWESCALDNFGNDTIYATCSSATWKYDIPGNYWIATWPRALLSDGTPINNDGITDNTGEGSGMAEVNGKFFVTRGLNTTEFKQYNPESNSWTTLPSTPATIRDGHDMVTVGTDIYAFRGNATQTFYKYDTLTSTWSTLANMTGSDNAVEGAALGYPGTGDHIFAVLGSPDTDFYAYCFQNTGSGCTVDTWTDVGNIPAATGSGSSFATVGTDLFLTRGGDTTDFWKYDLTQTLGVGTWDTSPEDAPADINDGGAIAAVGSTIYATRGDGTAEFFTYTPSTDDWKYIEFAPVIFGSTSTSIDSGNLIYSSTLDDLYVNAGAFVNDGLVDASGRGQLYRYELSAGADQNTWPSDPVLNDYVDIPNGSTFRGNAIAYPDSGDKIYMIQGGSDAFFSFDTDVDEWNAFPKATAPDGNPIRQIGADHEDGTTIVRADDGFFYILDGNSTEFQRYDRTNNEWEQMMPFPRSMALGECDIIQHPTDSDILLAACTGGSGVDNFYEYSINDNEWNALADQVNRAVQKLYYPGAGDWVYALIADVGALNYDLARYSLSKDLWIGFNWGRFDGTVTTNPGTSPAVLDQDEDGHSSSNYDRGTGTENVVANDKVYVLNGTQGSVTAADNKFFFEFDPSTNAWTDLTSIPSEYSRGADLVWDGNEYIYALHGDDDVGTEYLYRYCLPDVVGTCAGGESPDTWNSSLATPPNVEDGADLAFPSGGEHVYLLQGGGTGFQAYCIPEAVGCTANTWTALSAAPFSVGAGGSIKATDGSTIYAIRNGSTNNFWVYNITTAPSGSWTTLTDAPPSFDSGADLEYDGTYLYTPVGESTTTFYRYNVGVPAWSVMASFPNALQCGGGDCGGGIAYHSGDGDIYLTLPEGSSGFDDPNGFSGSNGPTQVGLHYRYSIANDEWPHYVAPVSSGAFIERQPGFGGFGTDEDIYVLTGNFGRTFVKYTIKDRAGTADRTELDPGEGSWETLPPTPQFTNGPGLVTFAGDIYALRGYADDRFWKFETTATHPGMLIAGTDPRSADPNDWDNVTDGSFGVTIDGTARSITGIDFTGDVTMNDVAATIQSAVQAVTSGSELVKWCTDVGSNGYFIIVSGTAAGGGGSVSLLSNIFTGTDISGASAGPAVAIEGDAVSGFARAEQASGDWLFCDDAGQPSDFPIPIGDTTAGSDIGDMSYDSGLNEVWVTHFSGNHGNEEITDQGLIWRYDVSGDTWPHQEAPASLPNDVFGGGSLAAHDSDTLYALRGNSSTGSTPTTDFWEYNATTNSWVTGLSATPSAVGTGADLVSDGTNTLYAVRGDVTDDFFSYNIGTDTWTDLSGSDPLPNDVGSTSGNFDVGGIDILGTDLWFATGHGTNGTPDTGGAFMYRYDTSGGEWPTIDDPIDHTNASVTFQAGSDLTSSEGSKIFALAGSETDPNFWLYNILTDAWTELKGFGDTGGGQKEVREGGSIEAVSTDSLYGLRGNDTDEFYQYDISGDTWHQHTGQDFLVNAGGTSTTVDSGDLTFTSNPHLYGIPGASTIVYVLDLGDRVTIEDINGGVDVVKNATFNVIVQATDVSGDPVNVPQARDITLSLETGTGVLGGTLTGTIPAASSQTTIVGVTYDTAETGVELRATDTSTVPSLVSTVSDPFNVVEPPPDITGVTPDTGSTAGDTHITITGTDFVDGARVFFDGDYEADEVTFNSSTELEVISMPHDAEEVDVKVVNPDNQSNTEEGAFTFAAPVVTLTNPAIGPTAGGTNVTITGDHFGPNQYRRAVTITNGSGSALTDHQVDFSLDTAALITAGKLNSDCSNIRVKDTDERTQLPYWIEEDSCNTATTIIWTKVPTIATGSSSIYVTYGNPNLSSQSEGEDVFEFFDDFEDGTYDATKWTATTGSPSQSGGNLVLANGDGLFAGDDAIASDTIWETRADPMATNRTGGALRAATSVVTGFVGDGGANILDLLWFSSGNLYAETNSGETLMGAYATGMKLYQIVYRPGDADQADYDYDNGTLTTTRSGTNAGGELYPTMYNSTGTGSAEWEWIRIRKYASTEPTTILAAETGAELQAEFDNLAATNVARDFTGGIYVDNSLTATTPAHAPATVNVDVLNFDGNEGGSTGTEEGTQVLGFTYATPPTVTAITPVSGPQNTTVGPLTIDGTDFVSGATAKITRSGESDITCSSTAFVDSTELTCTSLDLTGALLGDWNVVVTNPDTLSGQLDNGFEVTRGPPTVISVTPDEGTTAGGTNVTITGTDFFEPTYTRQVDITNTSSSVLTDYVVSFTLDTAALITNGKLDNDCADIRVKDTDGQTDIDYWFAPNECNTSSTTIYAEVPSIAATPTTTSIFVVYGESALTDQSSIANTFIDELNGTNLQGHWQMDESAENSCSGGEDGCDTSGNGLHGTVGTGTTIDTTGKFNNSRAFDGTSNVAFDIPTVSIPTDVSAGAWVKTANWSQNGFIIQKRVVNTQWELFLESGSLLWRGGSTTSVTCSTAGLTANTWYHLSATQDGTTARVYIDGTECNNGTVTAIGNSANQLDIGRHDSGYYFNGEIDEAFLFDDVLTPTEITNLSGNYGFSDTDYANSMLIRKWEPTSGSEHIEAVSTALQAETGGDLEVEFDGTAATNVQFVSDTSITATTPAHTPAELVDVKVTNPDGQNDTLANGYEYLGPDITNVNPGSGVTTGETDVVITGTNFVEGGYNRTVTVNNPTGGILTDHPVPIVLDTATLITAGKMRSDCGDIRVEESDNETTLPYWVEGCNTDTTIIWALNASIPIAGEDIRITYGNTSLTSESSLSDVWPTLAANNEFWLNSNEDTNTRTDGGSITSWDDQSGNSNDVTNNNDSPTFETNELNGMPVISFDGSNDSMGRTGFTDLPTGTNVRSMFAVNQYDSGGFGGMTYGTDNCNEVFGLVVDWADDYAINTWCTDFGSGVNANGAGYALHAAVMNGTGTNELIQYLDGSVIGTHTGSSINTGTNDIELGRMHNHSVYIDMDIAEIIIFSDNLTASERQDVEQYLNTKYNLYGSNVSTTVGSEGGVGGTSGIDVTFDGANATNINFVSSTTINATTPAHTPAEFVDVAVINPDSESDTLTNGYEYVGPTVTNVNPPSGPTTGNTNVTITGTNFVEGGYNRTITIDNPTGGVLTDHPVPIVLDTASLITATKMRSDCGDIRVEETDNLTAIDHWVEGCNTDTTIIWAKVASIPIAGKDIRITYGNSGLTSAASLSDVWPTLATDNELWLNVNEDTNTRTDGGSITSWSDQSGNGNTITNNNDSPTFETNELNGLPVISFDGSNDSLGRTGFTGLPTGSAVRSMFVVAQHNSTGWGGVAYGTTNCNEIFGLQINTINNYAVMGWCTDYHSTTNANGAGYQIHGAVFSGTGASGLIEYINGSSIGTYTASAINTGTTEIEIGRRPDDITYVDMDLAEILIFSDNLSTSEREEVEQYLNTKYNLYGSNVSTTVGDEEGFGGSQISATFDGIAATNINFVSSTELRATTPAHAAGQVDVVVTNPDGITGTLTNGYEYLAPPDITSVVPNSANTGTSPTVTINGTDFKNTPSDPTVTLSKFGQTNISCTNIQSFTSTSFTCDLNLTGAETGSWDVTVQNPDGQSDTLEDGFTVTYPAPTVTSVTPSAGYVGGGTSITDLEGTGFSELGIYQKPITITNNVASDLTGYQVLITMDTASLISAGKMNSDGSDIRVIDEDKLTNIEYWLDEETINTSATNIYVQVPEIEASDTHTIYVLYGNSNNTSESTESIFEDTVDNLIGMWKMEETSGTTVYDSSGNDNDLTAVNSSIVSGYYGNARDFNNTDKVLRRTSGMTPTSTTDFSVVLWANPTNNTGSFRGFFSTNDTGGNDWSTGITLDQGFSSQSNYEYVNVEGNGFTGESDIMTDSFSFGTWHQLAVTSEVLTNGVKLYVDGSANGSRNRTSSTQNMDEVRIGARYYSLTEQGYFNGTIDEVAMFNDVLTPTEISDIYSSNYIGSGNNELLLAQKAATEPTVVIGAEEAAMTAEFDTANFLLDFAFVSTTELEGTTPSHAAGFVDVTVTNPDGQSGTLTNGYEYQGVTVTAINPDDGPIAGGTAVVITGTNFLPDNYLAPITIDNTSGSTQTDYQVRFELDTASLITAGKMESDCADLRVKDTDQTTDIDFYLEGPCNDANTVVWAEVPSIPTGTPGKTIYANYGNNAAASASNGDNTFLFFDDFETGSIDTGTKWETGGSVSPGWLIDSVNFNQGSYGSKNNDISDGESVYIASQAGQIPDLGSETAIIDFDWEVSSESGFDFLFYCHDTVLPTCTAFSGFINRISGSVSWAREQSTGSTMTGANNRILFGYGKDGGSSVGADTGYVDAVKVRKYVSGVSDGTVGSETANELQVEVCDPTCTAMTDIVYVSDTTINATTPAHAADTVDVKVTNPDANSGTLVDGYTYNPPPDIISVTPNSGPVAGGTSVSVEGTDFISGAIPTFDGTACTSIVFVDSTEITCDTPPHAAGAVDVVVTNPDGQFDTLVDGYTYVVPGDPGLSTFTANPTTATADGVDFSILTATVLDSGSTPLPGKTVSVALTAGPGTPVFDAVNCTTEVSLGNIPPNEAVTDSNGQACFKVTSTTAGVDTFTATNETDGHDITQTADVTFTAGAVNPGNSTVVAVPDQVKADGVETSTVTVTLRDAFNNLVPGRTIELTDDGSFITYAPGTQVVSDSSGESVFNVSSTLPQLSVTFTATDITDSPTEVTIGSDDVEFTCEVDDNQQCIQIQIDPSAGVLTITPPDDYSFVDFPAAPSAQDAFSHHVTGTNETNYVLNVNDVAVVTDTRGFGGFTLQVQPSTPFEVSGGPFFDLGNFYVATEASSTGGTDHSGIEFGSGTTGVDCTSAPLDVTSSTEFTNSGAFTGVLGTGYDTFTVQDLMLCGLASGGRNGTFSQNVNYYLNIPGSSIPGNYQVTLTFDLTPA